MTLSIADQSRGGSIWIEGTPNLTGSTLQSDGPGLITNEGGAVFTSSGTMDNGADSNFILGDFAKLINNGVLHQRREFQPIQPERRHRRPEARDTG